MALPAWVLAGFFLAQIIAALLIGFLGWVGAPIDTLNQNVLSAIVSAIVYIVSLAIIIGIPWAAARYRTSLNDIGLQRFPSWLELVLAPAGFVVYLIVSAVLTYLAMQFLTFINFEQVQETGFGQLGLQYEYIVAFIMLVIVAPVAEEVLFRGYLLGKLRQYAPLWVAILVTSLLFAAVHGAWNVGIDVFALSIVLCVLRVWLKSLWAPIMVHMLKNGVAFYFLFINPMLIVVQ